MDNALKQELLMHPAADVFPMQTPDQFAALRESIAVHGFDATHPVTICDGMILDGRNRYKACRELNIEPTFITFTGNPWEKAWLENGARRDLEQGRKVAIRIVINASSAAWSAKQEEKQVEVNKNRSDAAKEQHAVSNPRRGETSGRLSHGKTPKSPSSENHSHVSLAKEANTSASTAARVQSIYNKAPERFQQILNGEKSVTQVAREMKKDELNARIPELPTGMFRVLYADPPWSYSDKLAGSLDASYGGAEKHYPSMSIPDLCALPIRDIVEKDAVLFLWVTSPLLFACHAVIKAWGFEYKASFVWDKVKHNMGHYNSVRHEFLLVCTRGSCTPEVNKLVDSVQSIERTKHSEKPVQFRRIIETLYPCSRKIELFARSQNEGWETYGNEA